MSWSRDYVTAAARAAEAGVKVNLAYTVPKEGANEWFDALIAPKGTPHFENAMKFLDFMMDPKVIAEVTNDIRYGNRPGRPATASGMELQALRDLVDVLALGVDGEPDEVEAVGRHRRDGGAIGDVVAGGEQLARVDRRLQPTLAAAPQRPREILAGGREDQDGLPHEGPIAPAGRIPIALAGQLRIGSDQAAGQEAGDVQLLPDGEVVADDDGDLGGEDHGVEIDPQQRARS